LARYISALLSRTPELLEHDSGRLMMGGEIRRARHRSNVHLGEMRGIAALSEE